MMVEDGVGVVVGVPIIAATGILVTSTVTATNKYISRLEERNLRLRSIVNKIRIDYEKVLKENY